MLKRIIKISCFFCFIFLCYAVVSIDFNQVNNLENNMLITASEIENINREKTFGKFINVKSDNKFLALGNFPSYMREPIA